MSNILYPFVDIVSHPLEGRKATISASNQIVTGSRIITNARYTASVDANGFITASLSANDNGYAYYEFHVNTLPETKFYGRVDNTGSFTLVSQSIVTGSTCDVLYDFANLNLDAASGSKMYVRPYYGKDSYGFCYPRNFSGSIVTNATTSSYLDESGTVTFYNVIPGIQEIEVAGTKRYISVAGSGNAQTASQCILTTVPKGIVQRINETDKTLVLSLSSSDARYLQAGASVNTASYAATASLLLGSVESASFALTASYAMNGGSGGSGDIAISASFASASISASYADTASIANLATTALTANTATSATNADHATTATSADFATQATNATSSISASYALSASNARSASLAVSAAFATVANSADSAGEAEFALTASHSTYAVTAGSATSATSATSASHATSASYFNASHLLNTGSTSQTVDDAWSINNGQLTVDMIGKNLNVLGNIQLTNGRLHGTSSWATSSLSSSVSEFAYTASHAFFANGSDNAQTAETALSADAISFVPQVAVSSSWASSSLSASNASSVKTTGSVHSGFKIDTEISCSGVAIKPFQPLVTGSGYVLYVPNLASDTVGLKLAAIAPDGLLCTPSWGDGTNVDGVRFTNAIITGSLLGNASTATSASFATSASHARSSSIALTANSATTATNANFATSADTATSATFALSADSASLSQLAKTASLTLGSASYAQNAANAQSAINADYALNATLATTALQSDSASFASSSLSALNALHTGSNSQTVDDGWNIDNGQLTLDVTGKFVNIVGNIQLTNGKLFGSASFATSSISASRALTASLANASLVAVAANTAEQLIGLADVPGNVLGFGGEASTITNNSAYFTLQPEDTAAALHLGFKDGFDGVHSTASWAVNSISASKSVSASLATLASTANTASNATSASYALVANTANSATTATSATNATTADTANYATEAGGADELYTVISNDGGANYLTFVTASADLPGYNPVFVSTGISCDPSTNSLTATTFYGAFIGNASTATSASYATQANTASFGLNFTASTLFAGSSSMIGLHVRPNGQIGITNSSTAAAITNLCDTTMPLTVNNGFVVQYSENGSDWFSVGKVAGGVIAFNGDGGSTRAGNLDLGARFNIAPVSDSIPALAVSLPSPSNSDIVRVSSPSVTTGDIFIIKGSGAGGLVGINNTSPVNKLDVGGNISCSVITASLHAANYIQLPYSASGKALTPRIETGSMYVNATNNLLYVYNGTAWKSASLA